MGPGIHVHLWGLIIVKHILFPDGPRVLHRLKEPTAWQAPLDVRLERGLRHEVQRERSRTAACSPKQGPVDERLSCFDGRVAIPENPPGRHAAFEDQMRLHAEESWVPDDEIGELAGF